MLNSVKEDVGDGFDVSREQTKKRTEILKTVADNLGVKQNPNSSFNTNNGLFVHQWGAGEAGKGGSIEITKDHKTVLKKWENDASTDPKIANEIISFIKNYNIKESKITLEEIYQNMKHKKLNESDGCPHK